MYEKMFLAITNSNSDFVICNSAVFNEDGTPNLSQIDYFALRNKEGLYKTQDIANSFKYVLWNKLFRKSIIDKNNIEFPYKTKVKTGYDSSFVLIYIFSSNNVFLLKDFLYNYLKRDGSLTVKFGEDNAAFIFFNNLSNVYNFIEKNNLGQEKFDIFLKAYYDCTRFPYSLLSRKNKKKALKTVKQFFYSINKKYCNPKETYKEYAKCLKENQKGMFLMNTDNNRSVSNLIEKIFSAKNEGMHKVICFFGIKIKIKLNKLEIRQLLKENNDINKKISRQVDNVTKQVDNATKQVKKIIRYNKSRIVFNGFQNFSDVIRQNIYKLSDDVDVVVGIPRSGIIPAYIIAGYLNKRVCSINEFINEYALDGGDRVKFEKENTARLKKVLIVDDSIYSGRSILEIKRKLEKFDTNKYEFKYCAIYARSGFNKLIDYYFKIINETRLFQWNYLNHSVAQDSCYDLDGVLCIDPADWQNDDGEKYINFILNAKPLFIPNYEIHSIVTSRLEKYRSQTVEWLAKNNVKYKNLYMMNLATAQERRALGNHAEFKAEIYKSLKDTILFIESNPQQAKKIADLSGKQCICATTDEMFEPSFK
jgi:uncharacterized HAD superfamily protein/adenine/guanine phosphoribosyltransferase-like PRPP-binding protein